MPMDLSVLEFIQALSKPETGTLEETALAHQIIILSERQETILALLIEVIDYIEYYEKKGYFEDHLPSDGDN